MTKIRRNLQTHIDTFLKTGGRIQQIPIGVGSQSVKKSQGIFTGSMDALDMAARLRDDRTRPVPDNRWR